MPAEVTERSGAILYLSLHGSYFENRGLLHFDNSVADQIGKQRQELRNAPGGLDELDAYRQMQSLGPESVRRMRAVTRSESGLGANERCT
jgi:hypothetical protein